MTGYLWRGKGGPGGLEAINAAIMAARSGQPYLRGGRHADDIPQCGTSAGAQRHWQRHEKACRACLLAAAAEHRRTAAGRRSSDQ